MRRFNNTYLGKYVRTTARCFAIISSIINVMKFHYIEIYFIIRNIIVDFMVNYSFCWYLNFYYLVSINNNFWCVIRCRLIPLQNTFFFKEIFHSCLDLIIVDSKLKVIKTIDEFSETGLHFPRENECTFLCSRAHVDHRK